jgi:hypothetical protein
VKDVVGVLFNPVYGYGRLLLPADTVVSHVMLLNRTLAEKQTSLGRALTLDELDQEYTALMDWLVSHGLCRHVQDVPTIISKEKWLQTQQAAIQRMAAGEDIFGDEEDDVALAGDLSEFDEDVDDLDGCFDGQCIACETWARIDDLGLCEECRTRFERDLVRQRAWDYSAWAFGLSAEGREALYRKVIGQHGQKLELIAPEGKHGRQSPAAPRPRPTRKKQPRS